MTILESLLNVFIPLAHAQAVPAGNPGASGNNFSLPLMLLVFVFFMYFAMWRPQSKRAKEQRDLINSLAKGDEVLTAGGILGKITKISDTYVTLAITDNVEIVMQKSSIANVLPKGTLKAIT